MDLNFWNLTLEKSVHKELTLPYYISRRRPRTILWTLKFHLWEGVAVIVEAIIEEIISLAVSMKRVLINQAKLVGYG